MPGDVRAARGRVAEDQRDRRDAGRRGAGQVAEDPPARDEDLLLGRQVGAAGLGQPDARAAGSRSAISAARSTFFSVHGLVAPPRTVGSLALIMHSTPLTTPMPVTTLAPTGVVAAPRRRAGTARGTASRGRAAARCARATSSLPRSWCRATYFSPPPATALACSASTLGELREQASRLAANFGARACRRVDLAWIAHRRCTPAASRPGRSGSRSAPPPMPRMRMSRYCRSTSVSRM